MRKSRYPNARDIRELVTPEKVARRAGVSVLAARAVVDASIFGARAVAASGAVVLLDDGRVLGPSDSWTRAHVKDRATHYLELVGDHSELAPLVASSMPAGTLIPRLDPVYEFELVNLFAGMARSRGVSISDDEADSVLFSWYDLIDEHSPSWLGQDVVVRRSWSTLESEFEDWLVENLDSTELSLELVQRQFRLPSGRRTDLLCRLTSPGPNDVETGDLVVIENKAGEANGEAVAQLQRYVAELSGQEIANGVNVLGIVAAAPIGEQADDLACDLGFACVTWGELGFLDFVWAPESELRPIAEFIQGFNAPSPWDRSIGSRAQSA